MISNNRPAILTVLVLASFLAIIPLFQNCSSSGLSDPRSVFFTSVGGTSSGNGEPYEGKPQPGEYYRLIPGYLCNGQASIHSRVSVTETSIAKTSIDPADCSQKEQSMPATVIEYTTYNPDYLGAEEGIYRRLDQAPDPARHDQVTETWCRLRSPANRDIGVVVTTDLALGSSTAIVRSAALAPSGGIVEQPESQFSVTRNLQNGTLAYQGNGLDLKMTLSAPSAAGKVSAQLRLEDRTYDMDCRTGSIIDQKAPSAPNLIVDFSGAALPASVAFERASKATYIDAAGMVRTADPMVPRFEIDPSTRQPLGLLIEPAATNLVDASEAFQNPSWSGFLGLQVTPDTAVAPDGTASADTLADTDSGAVSYVIHQLLNPADGATYTSSVFVKKGTAPGVALTTWFVDGPNSNNPRVYLDWSTLSLGTYDSPLAYGIETAGNGWYRLWIANTNTAAGAQAVRLAVEPAGVFPGDTGSVLAWGAQLEQGIVPTSYLPTVTGPATRAEDQVTVPSLGWYSANQGTFFAHASRARYERATVYGARPTLFSLIGPSGAEHSVFFDPSTYFHGLIRPASGAPADWAVSGSPSPAAHQAQKIFFGYGGGASVLAINGAQAPISGVDTSLAPSAFSIGGVSSQQKWRGHVKTLLYWPTLLESESIRRLSQ